MKWRNTTPFIDTGKTTHAGHSCVPAIHLMSTSHFDGTRSTMHILCNPVCRVTIDWQLIEEGHIVCNDDTKKNTAVVNYEFLNCLLLICFIFYLDVFRLHLYTVVKYHKQPNTDVNKVFNILIYDLAPHTKLTNKSYNCINISNKIVAIFWWWNLSS